MRSRHLVSALGAAALLMAPATGIAGKRCATAEDDPATSSEVISLVNAHRSGLGLATFADNARLEAAANSHAMAMARSGKLYHSNITEWSAGRSAAQNVGAGETAAIVFQAMLDSPPHREALESPKYRLVGIGGAMGCDGALRVTVNMMAGRAGR
jgi:uncharacterized protein YkwD